MKRTTWIVLGTTFFLVICLAVYALYLYNKPQADISKSKADFILKAADLINAFNTNEAEATEEYVDKILEVSGILAGWTEDAEGNLTLYLEDELLGVSCLLDTSLSGTARSQLGNKLVKGTSITVRGLCDGMLTDVKLSNGLLLE